MSPQERDQMAVREALDALIALSFGEDVDAGHVHESSLNAGVALDALVDELANEREARIKAEAALRDAEALLTQGQGSPECHYALGIIRAALPVSYDPNWQRHRDLW